MCRHQKKTELIKKLEGESMSSVKRKTSIHQHKLETNTYYSHGNVAYDHVGAYDYPTLPNYGTTGEKKKHKKSVKKGQAKRKAVATSRLGLLSYIKIFAALFVVFGGCLAMMGANASVAKQRVVLAQYKDQLNEIKNENAILSAELTEQVDLELIKERAINELGMAEPQDYQVIHIDVPKQSYTVQYAAAQTQTKKNIQFKDIINLFKKD